MTVALLLVTHDGLGRAFLDNARATLPLDLPTPVGVLEVPRDQDTASSRAEAERLIAELDQGDGVLALVDLGGATPSNVIRDLLRPGLLMVTGLNLAMLLRALNYVTLSLPEVAEKAADGACRGVAIWPEEFV